MAPEISFAKTTLSYPIVAASFDPYRGYLVVGGGGGAGRSGVGNKLTLLDVSSRAEISPEAEIELSRDEDAVTCVGALASKDNLIAYAGINSSDDAREANKNEHFRSFIIDYPKKGSSDKDKGPQGKIAQGGKSRLFTPPTKSPGKKDAYQRILRLSRPKQAATGGRRIGAIASSLAGDENEVVVFNATVALPQASDVIQRITPHNGVEANDIDIIETDSGEFLVAYCTDQEVYLSEIQYDFTKRKQRQAPKDPKIIYRVPAPDVFESPARLKLRSVRFLSPTHLLLLANLPNKSGVELQVLRLYSRHSIGTISSRKRLPGHVKAAVDLDVCDLNADDSGARQVAIAVAGADVSISVYTIEYHGSSRDCFGSLKLYHVLREVHPFGITKVVFQPFQSPWTAVKPKKGGKKPKPPGQQFLKIASTSFGNTVVVDSFPLAPLKADKPGSRYVLEVSPFDFLTGPASILTIGVVLLVSLLLLQGFSSYLGGGDGSVSFVPESIQRVLSELRPPGDIAHQARNAADIQAPVLKGHRRFRDLLPHLHHHHKEGKAVVIKATVDSQDAPVELSTEVHPDADTLPEEHSKAKKWEELTQVEKEKWKQRLTKSGEWAAGQGETVLKGVFFSEVAGFIGHLAADAMAG
jgi:prolactin regulatory element-binding protein